MPNTYFNIIEALVLICSASKGSLKVYLERRTEDPYKGYWMLPGGRVSNNETLEEKASEIFKDATGLENEKMFQSKIFSDLDRGGDERVIAQSFFAITDADVTAIKDSEKNMEWFDVDELPKIAFDHAKIINDVINEIKLKIVNNYDDILLDFFPSDFTLPELQKFYESIAGKKMDRRNFYKKFVSQDLVVDTGIKTTGSSGRPGVLYRFNVEKMKGKRI